MLYVRILCIVYLVQSIFLLQLNIYKSVTEIRQIEKGTGILEHLFKNDVYSNIIDGSISWDGTPFVRQELYQTIDSLKDVIVKVRQSCEANCQTIQAKIIDPNTMLLENLETGTYFYADKRSLEYVSKKPSDGGTTLIFEFENRKTKYNGILSYLMRGITWIPNYDLSFTDDQICSLRAYAAIRNNQQQEYQVDKTSLYSGDLQLINKNPSTVRFRSAPLSAKSIIHDNISAQAIQLDGEEKGFYFYSLDNRYLLRASSSIRLPFITVNPKCLFYYKAMTHIGAGQYKGTFQRHYDLIPNVFLPSGTLTIRDKQILIGQSYIPDVSANYTQTIVLDQDNDIRYIITGNLTASSEEKAKISWRTYSLDIGVFNYKAKIVKGQLSFFGAIQTNINSTTCNSVTIQSNMINLPFSIVQSEKYQCQLIVTLKWG